MNTNLLQPRAIFLYSIPETKKKEMESKNFNYNLFIDKIRCIEGVEVHELNKEFFSSSHKTKIMIILGEYLESEDALLLNDNSLLSLNELINMISASCSNTEVIELAFCFSGKIHDKLKKHTSALVNTNNNSTQIEVRLQLYSLLLKYKLWDLSRENYEESYDTVLGKLQAKQDKRPPQELGQLPEGTKLGTIDSGTSEKRVSVSSQKFVCRNYTFPLYVCLHYDLEKEEIEAVIKEQNHDADDLVKIGKLKAVQKGDEVKIKLSMLDHQKHTTDLITVCDSPSTFIKTLTICEEYQMAIFDVLVTENYSYNEFCSRVEVFKGSQRLIEPFCIKHTILTEEQYTRKIDVNILLGQKHYTGAPKSDIIGLDSDNYLDLKFFTSFDTLEKQSVLRNALKEAANKIDVDAGRDWVPAYIAYSFYSGKLKLVKRYVNFFSDIESLLPNTLTKIKQNKTGDKRYRSYTESLAGECGNWFIEDNSLPSMNEWKSSDYRYSVTDDRKREVQQLVAEIHKKLKREQ